MRQQDFDHLNLLAIFHYVMAGLNALFSLLPLLYAALGLAIINGGGPPGAAEIGWIFFFFGGGTALLLLLTAVLIGVAGIYLHKRKARLFIFIVAAIQCTNMPLGTILGIFTILVLNRDSVKELFEAGGYRDPEEDDYPSPPRHIDDRPTPRGDDRGYYGRYGSDNDY